jgi:phage gp29-like protein
VAKPVLYDAYNNEVTFNAVVPKDTGAELGLVRDPWLGRTTGTITPETLARLLRGEADLGEQMMLQKRMLRSPHMAACMRTLAQKLSRLPWEMLPFDDSPTAKQDAEDFSAFLNGLRWFHKMKRTITYGEFFTFVAAGLKWNDEYGLDGYTVIDPPRWARDKKTNALRLKVVRDAGRIEEVPINPRAFIIHSSSLAPGSIYESGMWWQLAWPWMFETTTYAWWVRFAERYGDPYIWAFFQRPEDKDSVLEAVTGMAGNARGAFPVGTEIKLQEAQRYGTSALYQAIIEVSQAAQTKLILGHVLNVDSKSGSGTLAGNAAADVSQQNMEGVGRGLEETIQEQLVTTWFLWHRGEEQVKANQLPTFHIKTDPPQDLERKAKVYVEVQKVLGPVGKSIDPSQIEDEFAIRTVDLPKAPAPTVPPPAETTAAASRRVAAGAKKAPAISSGDDVRAVSVKLVAKAAEDFGDRILEIFDNAGSIEEGADALWEGYRAMSTVALGSALRDATVTAELIGRGDVE